MNRIIAIAAIIIVQGLLSACGTNMVIERPGTIAAKDARDTGSEQAPVAGESVEQGENPYLLDRKSVPSDARRRFEQALVALEQQDTEWAITELQYLVENYPQLSGPSLNLALLYQQQGELEQAETMFLRSMDANTQNLTAYNQYGIFLREQGRFKEAEDVYLQALVVWEQHADSHRNIGVLYDLYMGDHEKALQHFYRYQALTGADDRAVAGWIADLERQLMMLAQGD
jgi:Tfp pilus assembly protein PilF